jgi:L-threonylcarbamoyladenylate synthase
MTMLKINPAHPESERIHRAAEIIMSGGVIGYPTETVYGLGANAFLPDAVERIFTLKQRVASQAILLIAADLDQVAQLVSEMPNVALRLAESFWPGPLTLIFNAGPKVIPELIGASGTVGVRIPGNAICLELLKATGIPITSTSANISGQQNPISAEEVLKYFGERLDLIIDGGKTPSRVPSTVLSLVDSRPVLIREGAIQKSDIEKIIGIKF